MLKYSLKSIGILLRYAKTATICRIVQLILLAVLTLMNLYFTQKLIDSITPFLKGETSANTIFLWTVLLIITMFFVADIGIFDNIIFISMKRGLNNNLTGVMLKKIRSLDYACFEDKDVHDSKKGEKIAILGVNSSGKTTLSKLLLGVYETEILSSFIDTAKDKTAVIISHRVGLCKLVDKIIVMNKGKIVEYGSHSELMNAGGAYAELYSEQEKWYR